MYHTPRKNIHNGYRDDGHSLLGFEVPLAPEKEFIQAYQNEPGKLCIEFISYENSFSFLEYMEIVSLWSLMTRVAIPNI